MGSPRNKKRTRPSNEKEYQPSYFQDNSDGGEEILSGVDESPRRKMARMQPGASTERTHNQEGKFRALGDFVHVIE